MNKEREKVLQEEVDSLLSKGAVERVKDRNRGFYSNIFLVAKKDGGLRPVINLSGLNVYIKKKTFRMASLKDVSQSLRRGDWAATIDLKEAYLHVPIAAQHRRFLRFWWKGSSYQFRRLPFGLSSALRTFTRLTLPLVTLCRANGVRIIVYLDDFLVLARSRPELHRHTRLVLDILEKAGFQRNPKKCHLEPRQRFEYLGLLWDTKKLRVFLPEDKIRGFRLLGHTLLSNPSLALAQRFLGKAIFARRAVQLGRMFLRPLQMAVIKALTSDRLVLSNDARESIRWWTRPPTDGMDLTPYSTQIAMTTDASNYGWGATMDEKKASGRWSAAERKLHINHLELLAVFRGVQGFLRHLRNKRVTVHLDNVTAAAYLAKEGGTRSETLNALTTQILIFCRDHGIALSPAYLPGIANLGADALSRGTETREWFINPRVSERIFSRLGLPQIDLFASRRSAQVKTYFSLDWRDNHSAGTNALNQSWTFKHMYAFPPPQVIPLILGRMRECKGTLILVTPFWSRAAWSPELLQMAVPAPLRLPQHLSTVRDLSTGRPLPSLQKLKLTVWLICGKHLEARGQITPWQNSSVDPGGVLQRPNMHVHGETGQSGVGDSLYQELRQL